MDGSGKRRKPEAGRRAFTLIEAVFALAVVASALVCLVSASRHAVQASVVAAARMRATTLGMSLAEEMTARGMTEFGPAGTFDGASSYRWEARIGCSDAEGAAAACHEVSVSVFHPGFAHEEDSVELRFLVARE